MRRDLRQAATLVTLALLVVGIAVLELVVRPRVGADAAGAVNVARFVLGVSLAVVAYLASRNA